MRCRWRGDALQLTQLCLTCRLDHIENLRKIILVIWIGKRARIRVRHKGEERFDPRLGDSCRQDKRTERVMALFRRSNR